jgi:hypothetical protein
MAKRAGLLVSESLCLLIRLRAAKERARRQSRFFAALRMTGSVLGLTGVTILLLWTWLVLGQ